MKMHVHVQNLLITKANDLSVILLSSEYIVILSLSILKIHHTEGVF